jgi:hypothetical protein
MFHAFCNDKDLADLAGQMKTELANAAAAVSPQGLKVLAANEEGWLNSQRIACAVPAGATALNARQANCLKSAFAARVQDATRFKRSDQTEETTTYQIGYASADLVSVRFDLRDLTIGAAHPNASVNAISFNMRTGARLSAADIFKPGVKWQDFLAARVARDVTKQLQGQDETARAIAPGDAHDAVANPNSWFVTDKALVLLLTPGALGPGAMDAYEVTIAWRDLKPYLNPQGPGPIKSA